MAYAYMNITDKATHVIKSSPGVLHRITINNAGSAWVITVYDNNAGSGNLIATIAANATEVLDYECAFSNGLTLVTSGTTAGDLTVMYG